ncbi:MAG: 50S ribosomal protein L18 [Candidatus Daviesbacteria bacterium]|nr:50S ribosomal protein L18 [Candidatus Daviesbacteria bacterium]
MKARQRRHYKIRKSVIGTSECPRLSVFRSNAHIYAQIIDDGKGQTLVAGSDIKSDKKVKKADRAYEIGKKLAEDALKKGIKKVVFDRGGFLYHGRVAKVADGAREGGLVF